MEKRVAKRRFMRTEKPSGKGPALGDRLTIEQLAAYAGDPRKTLRLSEGAFKRVRLGREVVEEIIRSGRLVYGVNTGFGRLKEFTIAADKIAELQENLLQSHAVGVGPAFSPEETRAILLLRIMSLARGHSGVREELMRALVELFNAGILPVIPEQGSCGASGDLAPLAHSMLPLLGLGEARIWQGDELSDVLDAALVLRKKRLKPICLAAKEGLALINGTQVMTALGALSAWRLHTLAASADVIGALTLDALLGSRTPFHPAIQKLRVHFGQKQVAQNLSELLDSSEILQSHLDCNRVQDAYSLRCMPQVHGSLRDALAFASRVLEVEMGSVTDNPLIFPGASEAEQVLSGGNFHGQPVAQALDFLTFATTDFMSLAERRIERLLNPDLSGLPAFLAVEGGLHSGFMMLQVTAASLVSESRALSFPVSCDSIPTSANQEDHVSMGTTSARKLRQVVKNLEHVLAIELLCAAQAIEYRRPLSSSRALEAVHAAFRKRVKALKKDRLMGKDIEAARGFIASGGVLKVVRGVLPQFDRA